jgi:adenosylcobyric acid synthase
VIPGTKRTADDLRWLRERGFSPVLERHIDQGLVVGICGGFQMLGASIDDPTGIEGGGSEPGFGALPIRTELRAKKTVRPVRGRYVARTLFGTEPAHRELDGYEIHTGTTAYGAETAHAIEHGAGNDGAVARDGAIVGTYLHGVFGDDGFRHAFVDAARTACELAPASERAWWRRDREAQIDRWATHVAAHVDIAALRALVAR